MAAGRGMDRLVAERVFGYVACDGWTPTSLGMAGGPMMMMLTPCTHADGGTPRCYPSECGWRGSGPPHYSTHLEAAWRIVDALTRDGCDVMVNWGDGGYSRSRSIGEQYGQDTDPPQWECALWWLEDGEHRETTQYARTVELAICRAALRYTRSGRHLPQ